MTDKLIPIDSLEKELCVLCIVGLVYYPYMTPEARSLYDTITEEEKEEIKEFFEKKGWMKNEVSNL